MASKASFYISEDKDFKGRLFFKLSPEGNGERFGTSAVTEFDSVATKDHVASYRDAYKDFKKANRGFVLQWPELDVAVEPEVVASVVEVVEEEVKEEVKELEQPKPVKRVFARKKEVKEPKEPEAA